MSSHSELHALLSISCADASREGKDVRLVVGLWQFVDLTRGFESVADWKFELARGDLNVRGREEAGGGKGI